MDCFWPWPTIPPRRTTPQPFERATPLAQGIVSFMTMFLKRTPVRIRSLPTATGIPFCASSTPNGGKIAKSGRVVCLLHMLAAAINLVPIVRLKVVRPLQSAMSIFASPRFAPVRNRIASGCTKLHPTSQLDRKQSARLYSALWSLSAG